MKAAKFPRNGTLLSIMLLAIFVSIVAPTKSKAASYWVELGRHEIAHGINGFVWLTHGGPWDAYGSHCDARSGAYVAGAYCKLRFNVPAGLTAGQSGGSGGGIVRGIYRTNSPAMVLRTSRPWGNPDYTTDSNGQVTGPGPFAHGWGALGGYVETGLQTTKAVTLGQTPNNLFEHHSFTILLHDPSAPGITNLTINGATASGWRGRGCHGTNYSWVDSGSQMQATSLTNLNTGKTYHSWVVPASGIVSGYPSVSFNTCVDAPASGAYTLRSTGVDRSGNVNSHDTVVHFDLDAPSVSDPTLDNAAVNEGMVYSAHEYARPNFRWKVSDGHSGIGQVTASFAGAAIPVSLESGYAVLKPSNDLPLGKHTLSISVVDNVGNTTTKNRTITFKDTKAPSIVLQKSLSSKDASPVLDLKATDDRSGIDASSWRVTVNGKPLVVSSNNEKLHAEIGRLVDGQHEIKVTVKDRAGNEGELVINHEIDASPDVPQLSGDTLTGIHVWQYPISSKAGETHRIKAVITKSGRPVEGRAELQMDGATVAWRDIENDGTIDLALTVNEVEVNVILVAPAGAGLDPVQLKITCEPCAEEAPRPDRPVTDAAGNGIVGPTTQSPQPVSPKEKELIRDTQVGKTIERVIEAVQPVAQFALGAANAPSSTIKNKTNGKKAPHFKISVVKQRRGAIKKSGVIKVRLWTNELSVVTIRPKNANRRNLISMRRKYRTINIRLNKKEPLRRTLQSRSAGKQITIPVHITVADRNNNKTARWVILRLTV